MQHGAPTVKRKRRATRKKWKILDRGGQNLKGKNRRTGLRNLCYRCDSGYHLAPRRPLKDAPGKDSLSVSPRSCKSPRPPYSSTPMKSPGRVQPDGSSWKEDTGVACDQSFPTSLDLGG